MKMCECISLYFTAQLGGVFLNQYIVTQVYLFCMWLGVCLAYLALMKVSHFRSVCPSLHSKSTFAQNEQHRYVPLEAAAGIF